MTDATTPRRRFRLVIELLEDLHTGCGTGSGVVDRALARDPDGRPVIPRSHLQGIWRDNGERLLAISETGDLDLITQDRWQALFGMAGGQRGCLIAPELKPIADQGAVSDPPSSPATLDWNATARRTGSRVPDDHSLRRTEYLPAGTCLAGIGYLNSDDPKLELAFAQVRRMTDRLGSERTRGSGLIRIADFQWLAADAGFAPADPNQPATGLRLLLRALAPLCIPTTGFPGNIVPSESHIPGRMLFGSLARYALDQGRHPVALFERRVRIGPAYPLPPQHRPVDADELAGFQVLPLPLCLYTPKPGLEDHRVWPHWAGPAHPHAPIGPGFIDQLADPAEPTSDTPPQDKTRAKRPKPQAYLFSTDGGESGWHAFNATVGLRMRNQRGTSLRDIKETDTALFTTEQIPAGTCFIADLSADSTSDLRELRDVLPGLCGTAGPTGVLRVGRGGGPVEVIGWCLRISSQTAEPSGTHAPLHQCGEAEADQLRITLTTDTIIRDPVRLGFHTQLSAAALCDALEPDPPPTQHARQRRFSDTQRYIGFNAASGLPMAPKIALRRGSTLRIDGPLASLLRDRLKGRDTIGERRWEGCGRFLLDFAPAAGDLDALAAPARDAGRAAGLARIGRREDLLASAERYAVELAAAFANDPGRSRGLTRSQCGNLRGVVAGLPQGASFAGLSEALLDYAKRVGKRRDGGTWSKVFTPTHGLIDALQRSCVSPGRVIQDADLFLRELRRYAVADEEDPQPTAPEPETNPPGSASEEAAQ